MSYGTPDPTGNGSPRMSSNRKVLTLAAAPRAARSTRTTPTGAPELAMVFCRGKLAYTVEQRTDGDHTSDPRLVSQDMTIAPRGVLALSAHGRDDFHSLVTGDVVTAVPKAGPARKYKVAGRWRFKTMADPTRVNMFQYKRAPLKNLTDGTEHDPNDVWEYFYRPGDRLIFHTCLMAEGSPIWGRAYVVCDRQP